MSIRPQSQRDPNTERDEEEIRRYVENFALILTRIGMQRMASRVFALLSVTDSGQLTAAEIAEGLSVSPAAVSGAVRYLEQIGMIAKEREPGARRDHYRLHGDLWYAVFVKRDRMVEEWRDAADDGVGLLGAGTPAGKRLAEMRDFMDFVAKQMPLLYERWLEKTGATERAG